jgi:hypothetical protein
MNRPFFGLLAVTALLAVVMAIAPAYAAESKKKAAQQVKYCNELPYNECVKCAISRGYSPSQYGPYCRRR